MAGTKEVTRYDSESEDGYSQSYMIREENGDWVAYSDYLDLYHEFTTSQIIVSELVETKYRLESEISEATALIEQLELKIQCLEDKYT